MILKTVLEDENLSASVAKNFPHRKLVRKRSIFFYLGRSLNLYHYFLNIFTAVMHNQKDDILQLIVDECNWADVIHCS